MSNFESAITDLDLNLFSKIDSQSTDQDKRSFLAIQLAVRKLRPGYKYLEIGSYLGGSIQPHLLDEACERIYSIDKRPERQPDARGFDYTYLNNSTERMLEKLRTVAPDHMGKIVTLDGDSGSIDPAKIAEKIDLCFIDGEHTDAAVLSDFKFCLRVLNENGCIAFHDAQITYNGIAACVSHLEQSGITFRAYGLPSIVFVVELGDFPVHSEPAILERLTNNHQSYLYSLQDNDRYRKFATKYPFRMVRNFISRVRGGNVSH
ncbi:MAG TPA: class I SAM-dependent methyltransferase [Pyrinomonadaceae bacterium]|nr:class I SAM-dependent methyltransferase [Pyrinomonadaceae bacterium]